MSQSAIKITRGGLANKRRIEMINSDSDGDSDIIKY